VWEETKTRKAFFLPSPVTKHTFRNKPFFLKRDELIHPDFSGNKARKFHYFLTRNFPDVHTVVSYGSAQSNAMYTLSVLAKMRGWRFVYAVHHIAPALKADPHGNYNAALANGMELMEGYEALENWKSQKGVLFIEEGGRQREAQEGVKLLADEIAAWQHERRIERLHVFLPSGTGTTALFLQKHLPASVRVFTVPCVGDEAYLRQQFRMLEADEASYPVILPPPKRYRFGKLYKEHYAMWQELRDETGVTFELLYDPVGWHTLLHHGLLEHDVPLLYVHQGGLKGNESMVRRYCEAPR